MQGSCTVQEEEEKATTNPEDVSGVTETRFVESFGTNKTPSKVNFPLGSVFGFFILF